MAAEFAPEQYACAAFGEFVPVPTSETPTDEGVRCVTCGHFIALECGAIWDHHGDACCMGCASHRLDLREERLAAAAAAQRMTSAPPPPPPPPPTHVALALSSLASTVQVDVQSAVRHIETLVRRDPPRATELHGGIAQQGLRLEDVAARGVLCAYAEAEAICERLVESGQAGDGASAVALEIASALIGEWEAAVPSSLLILLHAIGDDELAQRAACAAAPAAEHPQAQRTRRAMIEDVRREVARARRRCATLFGTHDIDDPGRSVEV